MSVRRAWLLVIGSLAIAGLSGTIGYLLRGGEVHSARSRLARARTSERRLAAEAARTRAADSKRLARARMNQSHASGDRDALLAELLSFAGARATPRSFCSSRDFPHIHVAILAPSNGARVRSPVIAHLLTDRPLGCMSEYYVTVDRRPFEPVATGDPRLAAPPESPQHPLRTRLVPPAQRTPPNGACFSGAFHYLMFRLHPGRHVIAVDGGCEMGTEVPQPVRSAVHFSVTQ